VLSFAFSNENPQQNQVGNPSKDNLKTYIHQKVSEQMMWVGEDINPGVHS
jgi:hypothetical protein